MKSPPTRVSKRSIWVKILRCKSIIPIKHNKKRPLSCIPLLYERRGGWRQPDGVVVIKKLDAQGLYIPTRFSRGPLSTRKVRTSHSLVLTNYRLRTRPATALPTISNQSYPSNTIKNDHFRGLFLLWWTRRDSNPGPTD